MLNDELQRLWEDSPVRRELLYRLRLSEQMYVRLREIYPHYTDSDLELPVGWMLSELLEKRVHLLKLAVGGRTVDDTCSPSRQFTIQEYELEEIFGTADFSEQDIEQLLRSSAAHYLAVVGGLENVKFTVMGSMMWDQFYVDISIPTI